ncbi:hypothetical protein QOT17_016309 [Balamuthia mandrillaris]
MAAGAGGGLRKRWGWALVVLVVRLVVSVGGEDDSPVWPEAFIARGHAPDWDGTSVVYYDHVAQMMRRDTMLAYPPHHIIPPDTIVRTKQPVMVSWIWRNDKVFLLFSQSLNGWGQPRCVWMDAPRAVPPPDWMKRGYSPSFTTRHHCQKTKKWFGSGSGWEQQVNALFLSSDSATNHKKFTYHVDVDTGKPAQLGYEDENGFVFRSFEELAFGVDEEIFELGQVECTPMKQPVKKPQ